jgi:hypothetical protein
MYGVELEVVGNEILEGVGLYEREVGVNWVSGGADVHSSHSKACVEVAL